MVMAVRAVFLPGPNSTGTATALPKSRLLYIMICPNIAIKGKMDTFHIIANSHQLLQPH